MCKKQRQSGILCKVCLDNELDSFMQPTGKIYAVCPQKRLYKCSKCGYKEIVEEIKKEQ